MIIPAVEAGVIASSFIQTKISYVGFELGVDPIYPVQRWSSASWSKLYDLNNTERYGTRGYYQIRPILLPSSDTINVLSDGLDLGTTYPTHPTLFQKPSFIDQIQGYGGKFVNFNPAYPLFLGPDGSSVYSQGGLSIPIASGPRNGPLGANTLYLGELFTFTLKTFSRFRIGIATDTAADGNYAPNYLNIFNTKIGPIFSERLNRQGISKLVFFDIVGHIGDTFIVGSWQDAGTQTETPFSLITFD
jgi:hypothetical protein